MLHAIRTDDITTMNLLHNLHVHEIIKTNIFDIKQYVKLQLKSSHSGDVIMQRSRIKMKIKITAKLRSCIVVLFTRDMQDIC